VLEHSGWKSPKRTMVSLVEGKGWGWSYGVVTDGVREEKLGEMHIKGVIKH